MCELEERFGKYDGFEYKPRVPRNRLVEGVGINDSPFILEPTIAGKKVRHPAYSVWRSMLKRCYSNKCKEKHPTYEDVTCCDEWLLFTNFAKWFKDNYIEGWQLDKDLLVKNNKVYDPNYCIFAPRHINSFLTLRGNHRGDTSIGVKLTSTGKFQSQISDGSKRRYLGIFKSKEQAHKTWQRAKLEQAIAFDFTPLQRVINQLKFEIENNLETTTL